MARPIVLSNGELHVGINAYGLVHDFYYPYVGLENHAAGINMRHKVGVWVDGRISWLDDGSWQISLRSQDTALAGYTRALHNDMKIALEFEDFIAAKDNIFMRNIHVVNHSERPRQVRLFMHQRFVIGDSASNTDTAQYLPDSDAILHYRGRRAFVIGGQDQTGTMFDQHSIGLFGIEGHEGTFRDADDGELSNSNVEHGRVDSTLRFALDLQGHSSMRTHYWIAAGQTARDALSLHRSVINHGILYYLKETHDWWFNWLEPARKIAEKLPREYRMLFTKSAMLIKSHIDKRGAIVASTDTAMLNYSRDSYAYCWPRDGAYAIWPLIRMGYTEEPLTFFEFYRDALHPGGYLMHKYRADGAIGSSWHTYVHGDVVAPPIQEDETAIVLYMFAQYYHANPSQELLDKYYNSFVKPMTNFLALSIDPSTHLPKPSYDLWEEKFLTTTYTTSVVYAALLAAAKLAEQEDSSEDAVRWRTCAEDMRQSAKKYLYNEEKGYLRKGYFFSDEVHDVDDTLDTSSFFGPFMYGLFDLDSSELTNTIDALKTTLFYNDDVPGLARYENDNYRRISPDSPSNWWFIPSLWLAQYHNEVHQPELTEKTLQWVNSLATSTGLLSEQINPQSATQLSVAPLIWSHAAYLSVLLDRADTYAKETHE